MFNVLELIFVSDCIVICKNMTNSFKNMQDDVKKNIENHGHDVKTFQHNKSIEFPFIFICSVRPHCVALSIYVWIYNGMCVNIHISLQLSIVHIC